MERADSSDFRIQVMWLLLLSRLFFGDFPVKDHAHRNFIGEKCLRMTDKERRDFLHHRHCFGGPFRSWM
jgi:hypothetical protein